MDSGNNDKKMQFLDSLFEKSFEQKAACSRAKLRNNSVTTHPELEPNITPRRRALGSDVKIWMGLFFSFFFLCYVFDFSMFSVVPLLFLGLVIYCVISMTKSEFCYYLGTIRKHFNKLIKHLLAKYFKHKEEPEMVRDYKLIEI